MNDLGDYTRELALLHRSLLSICARNGNISLALRITGDIRRFAKTKRNETPQTSPSSTKSLTVTDNSSVADVDMGANEWKLLMITAYKARHWKVCLGTLPFLRPYVEGTKRDEEDYQYAAEAFTYAAKCLEDTGHWAWALRAVDDWMAWDKKGGRGDSRPPLIAVLAICRLLVARGRDKDLVRFVSLIVAPCQDCFF